MAAPIPFATLQRAEGLPADGRSVVVGAGIGASAVGWPEGGAGGVVQARYPTGPDAEVSLTGQAIAHECSGCREERQGAHLGFGARVGYRTMRGENSAVLMGMGVIGYPGGRAVGFDVGLVQNLGRRGYLAGRAGISMPVETDDSFRPEDRVPTTSYGLVAIGARALGASGLIGELGLGAIQTDDETGAAAYLVLGVDFGR